MARDKERHKDKDPNAVALGQRGGRLAMRSFLLSDERRLRGKRRGPDGLSPAPRNRLIGV